jgi:hypothetical protein
MQPGCTAGTIPKESYASDEKMEKGGNGKTQEEIAKSSRRK